MAGRVEEHPDSFLRLHRGDRGSEGDCPCDHGVEVFDLEVEVHHGALLHVDGRLAPRPSSSALRVAVEAGPDDRVRNLARSES